MSPINRPGEEKGALGMRQVSMRCLAPPRGKASLVSNVAARTRPALTITAEKTKSDATACRHIKMYLFTATGRCLCTS